MDLEEVGGFAGGDPKPRQLPDDLPTSLDDRRSVPVYGAETEIYDAWQGKHADEHMSCKRA